MPSTPFEPSSMGTLRVKNRFVRSATWEGMAHENGSCTERLVELIGQLAEGEVGLIVSSHAFVSPEGQAGPWQLGIHDDKFIRGLGQMAKAAHDGGSAIVVQLAHAGLHAATSLTKMDAIGPSSLPREGGTPCKEMTLAEIQRTVDGFVAAAVRTRDAGFDGVQIHAAHGYLLSQFLSPHYNKRQDEFGGSTEKNARIVLEVLGGIKSTLGNDFPVLIKINSEDFIDGGLTVRDLLQTARMLEEAGIDAIELSGGTVDAASQFKPVRRGRLPSEDKEVFYREAAVKYKESIRVPLILVGGIRSYSVAESLIADGITDFVSLSRPFIREPQLVARWKGGDTAMSGCRSCNLCFRPIIEGEGMHCVSREREQQELNQ